MANEENSQQRPELTPMSWPFPASLPADKLPMIKGTLVDFGHRVPMYYLAWSWPTELTDSIYPDSRGDIVSWWPGAVMKPWIHKYQPQYKSKIGVYFRPKTTLLPINGKTHLVVFINANHTEESVSLSANQEYRRAAKETAKIPDDIELRWIRVPETSRN